MSLSFCSFNVRGIRDLTKRKAVFFLVFFGSNHSAGVAILKGSFKGKIVNTKVHNGGRWIILTVSLDGKMFLLGTVYASNIKKNNVDLFSDIENEINKVREIFHDIEIILGGDFNIVPDAKIDRIPIPIKPSSSDSELSKFCENLGIIDIWRNKNPFMKDYTWSNRDKSKQSRIDLWLISNSLEHNTNKVSIEPSILSDHKMIYLLIKWNNETSFKGSKTYWKLNNRLLELDSFKHGIKKIIQTFWNQAKQTNLYCKNWELMKFQIRQCN